MQAITIFHLYGSTHFWVVPVRRISNPEEVYSEKASSWILNPPHASHIGEMWERVIETVRRNLNTIIMESKKPLTHDVLNTFIHEVCAVINSRPFANVSVDPTQSQVLSHSVLLT